MKLKKLTLLLFIFLGLSVFSQGQLHTKALQNASGMNSISTACNVALIRSTLTAAGNIELLGMNNTCSLYFINPQFMTGPQAQAYAQTFGANLISIQSATENAALLTALSNQGYASSVVWIGFSDAVTEGSFTWYDGAPVVYTNWAAAEPNDAGGEDYTQIYADGTWNDLNCSGYNSLSVIEVNLCPQVSATSNVGIHCPGTNVTLNASTLLGSPNYTYTWIQSGAETFTNTSTPGNTDQITVTSMAANTFTVYSEDRYACPQSSIISLSVSPGPSISISPNVTICPSESVTLNAGGATSYTWLPGTSLNTTNGNVVIATPSVPTTYTVHGLSGACVGTSTVNVGVFDNGFPPNIYIIQKNSLCDTNVFNWLNITSVTPTLAQGTLPSGLTVNATHSNGGMSTTPSMFSGGVFPVTYSVPIGSTTIRNDLGGTFNFCFNQPVINPQIAFASIGQGGLPITINTSIPYQVLWTGIGMTYVNSTTMIGAEGYTIIRFPGVHTCVSLNYIGDENYCNLAFGVMDADCQGRPICPGEPVELVGNGASTYTWSNGANTVTTTPTPSISTNYSVTGTNANGCVNTATTAVIVNPSPTVTVNSSTICVGQQTATLTASGASTYSWVPGTGLNASTGAAVIGAPLSTQIYTVTGTDSNGCTDTKITSIAVNPLPTITVNSPSICVGQQTATLTANGALTYSWIPGTGLSSTLGTVVTGTPGSTTNYTVAGIDINGCINGTITTIVVNPLPTITVNSASICIGQQTATLTANGATTYSWIPGTNLNTTTGAVVTGTPSSTTNYTVAGIDINGCINGTITTIVVNPLPTVTVNSASICVGQQTATLTANGALTYSWIPGTDLSATTGAVVTGTPSSTTNYTVAGMDINGCINGTITTIAVSPLPTVTVNSSTICIGQQTATLTANGATTYSWIPGTGLSATTGTVVTGTPSSTTNYTITGIDVNGCINGTVTTIAVNPLPTVTVNSSTICIGQQTATLTANGALTYSWIPGTNLSATTGAVVTGTPPTTQNYTVAGMDINGCINGTVTTIAVNPLPTVTVNSSTICIGQQTATLTANGATTYSWIPGTDLSATTGAVVTGTPSSTQNYTVAGIDANGCINGTITTIVVNPLPTVTVNSSTICPGSSATLTATGATNYTWTPNQFLNTSTSATVISTPTSSTTYTIDAETLTCTTSTVVNVTISNTVVINASASNPTICPMGSSTLTANGATTYTWSPSASLSTSGIGTTVTATPALTETYTVIGSTGTCTNSAQIVLTVTTTPVITVASNPTICSGSSTPLSVSGANSYTWSPGTNLTATNVANPNAHPPATQTYTVNGATTLGCTNFTTVIVTVIPTPTLSVSSNTPNICEGGNATLSAQSATAYTWSPAASVTSANSGTTITTPNATTNYTVVGSNGTGPFCVTSQTFQLIVIPETHPVTLPASPMCFGKSSFVLATGATSYSWAPTATVLHPHDSGSVVNPPITTIYTVTATKNGVCAGTATVEVKVNPLPIINAGQDTTINMDEAITLHGTGDSPIGFVPTDGIPLQCNFCPDLMVNPQESTCYLLKGESVYGCISYDEVCVNVTKDWALYIPNAFTPNNDFINEVFVPAGYGIDKIDMSIFNRWGNQVFKNDDDHPGWDGKTNGVYCEEGVYVYLVEIETMNHKKVKRIGHVTLIPRVK